VVTKELFGGPGIGNFDPTGLKKGDLLLRGRTRLGKGDFIHARPLKRTTRPGAVPEGVPWRVLLVKNIQRKSTIVNEEISGRERNIEAIVVTQPSLSSNSP
jgi:hypothetical protein